MKKKGSLRLPSLPSLRPAPVLRNPAKEDDREELFFKWRDDPSYTRLTHVLDAYEPEIQRRVRALRGAHVPPPALKRFAQTKALRAIKKWDPDMDGRRSLSGWIEYNLRNLTGDAARYQNDEVRLRGKRHEVIGTILDTQDALSDSLGRPPTIEELSVELGDHPKITAKVVAQALNEYTNGNARLSVNPDPFGTNRLTPDQVQVMRAVRLELPPDEQLVWDYKLGINGKPAIAKKSDIAKLVNRPNSFVSRALQKINRKVREAGGEEF